MDWIEAADANAIYKVDLPGGQRRLREAILYVCEKSKDMERFGAVKLNKILWRADFRSYLERKAPITGRQYQKQKKGPVPVEMPPVIREMLRDNLIKIERQKVGPHWELRHVALVSAVLTYFSQQDLDYLDESITHYRPMTGTESSDSSHGTAWKVREIGDPIPYQAAFYEDKPLPQHTLARLASMAKEKRWRSA